MERTCQRTASRRPVLRWLSRDGVPALVHDIGTIGFPDAMLSKPVSAYTPVNPA